MASLIKQYLRGLPEPIVWADEIIASTSGSSDATTVEVSAY